MKSILETGEYFNRNIIRSNRISAGAVFFLQVILMFFFAFFVSPPPTTPTTIELPDMFTVTGVSILVLIGINFSIKDFLLSSVQQKIVCGLRLALDSL